MPNEENKGTDESVISRLAGRGEDAVTRLMDELGKNPRVTDALSKVMDAKGKADVTTKKTLGQVGLAAADEIRELRGRLEKLETRLSQMEGSAGGQTQSGRKSTTSTKASGGTATKASSGKSASAKRTAAKSGTGGSSKSTAHKSGGSSGSSSRSGSGGSSGSSGSGSS